MKMLPGLTKCSLVVIAAFCFIASDCDRKHNAIFLPNYDTADQIILPGTALSEEDAAALKKTLLASDQTFYIIQPWIKGEHDGPALGKLPFPKCLKAHDFDGGGMDENKKTGVSRTNFSRWTRVIGQGCQTRCVSATNQVRFNRHHGSSQASQDLVNSVKPTLQKYQKE
jgi:hypothetical protein